MFQNLSYAEITQKWYALVAQFGWTPVIIVVVVVAIILICCIGLCCFLCCRFESLPPAKLALGINLSLSDVA